MKLLNFVSPTTSYKLVLFIGKLSGFVFFSAKHTLHDVSFYENWTDYVIFTISFFFSVVIAVGGSSLSFKVAVKSVIVGIGTDFLFKISLYSIVVTKFINMIGRHETYKILELFKRIDKKVSINFD